VLGVGLALAVATPILSWWDHGNAERLRADGVPVSAAITGSATAQHSHAAADYIDLTYVYDGVRRTSQTRCGGSHGCAERPGPTLQIWVDPKHPNEFVTADGNTNDADLADLAKHVLLLPAGALTLWGGLGIWAARWSRRPD
jgi:hypothetical protein